MGETYVLDDDRSGASVRPEADDAAVAVQRAVDRLRHELAAYRPLLPDRAVAEDELDALAAQAATVMASGAPPDTERVHHSLLLVAAALGSVSALTEPLGDVRQAVEALAKPR